MVSLPLFPSKVLVVVALVADTLDKSFQRQHAQSQKFTRNSLANVNDRLILLGNVAHGEVNVDGQFCLAVSLELRKWLIVYNKVFSSKHPQHLLVVRIRDPGVNVAVEPRPRGSDHLARPLVDDDKRVALAVVAVFGVQHEMRSGNRAVVLRVVNRNRDVPLVYALKHEIDGRIVRAVAEYAEIGRVFRIAALNLNGGVNVIDGIGAYIDLAPHVFRIVVGIVLAIVGKTDGDGHCVATCHSWIVGIGNPNGVTRQYYPYEVHHILLHLLKHQERGGQVGSFRIRIDHHKAAHNDITRQFVAVAVLASHPCRDGMDAVRQYADILFLHFRPC